MFHFASPSIILVFHEKFEKEFSGGGEANKTASPVIIFIYRILKAVIF